MKFAGCYHGHVDALLVRAGSGALTLGVPDSPGVPPSVTALTWTAEFNDVAGVRDFLRARAGELAAVIVEPVAGNMGVVAPAPGFLEMLREETSRAHCLLVFDEVITGFRVGWGGAQGRYGVTPDLTCLGKVIGGGLPLAAFGGRRDLMEQLAPTGAVYQAGTLSGNPLAVAAGLATLDTLRQTPGAYDRLEQLGARAEEVLGQALAAASSSASSGCATTATCAEPTSLPLRASSTGCWRRAYTFLRRSSRRCSSPWHTPRRTSIAWVERRARCWRAVDCRPRARSSATAVTGHWPSSSPARSQAARSSATCSIAGSTRNPTP